MRILSGIQPTSSIHIGNYLGAINQWKELQEIGECIFFIADLHALTVYQEPKTLNQQTTNIAIELVAAGLDPEKMHYFHPIADQRTFRALLDPQQCHAGG